MNFKANGDYATQFTETIPNDTWTFSPGETFNINRGILLTQSMQNPYSDVTFTLPSITSSGPSGNAGNDTFHAGSGNSVIDGGAGVDTIIFNSYEYNYTITPSGAGFSITGHIGTDGTVTETNVEKLQFSDHTLTIDSAPSETLLESYRIYKAAFDRAPDYGGLGFWYNAMSHGQSISSVADGFIHSNEFVAMYGSAPTDSEFVSLVYQHVLGRALDQGGFDFWLNDLHVETRAQVLAHFSESAENIANLSGVVSHGIIYEAYTG
ncbi:MAG: DUF4214 domain-containing protein [Chlorobiales bacterium]|nr:DUF4214 domain-containing protein [Chlorobiales bacterium]